MRLNLLKLKKDDLTSVCGTFFGVDTAGDKGPAAALTRANGCGVALGVICDEACGGLTPTLKGVLKGAGVCLRTGVPAPGRTGVVNIDDVGTLYGRLAGVCGGACN